MTGKVSINSASIAELMEVPNVGPMMANEIHCIRKQRHRDGRMTFEDFQTLSVFKRHSFTTGYFDFTLGIVPLTQDADQLVAGDGSPQAPKGAGDETRAHAYLVLRF